MSAGLRGKREDCAGGSRPSGTDPTWPESGARCAQVCALPEAEPVVVGTHFFNTAAKAPGCTGLVR